MVPFDAPVMLPLQVRLPLELVIVQPVLRLPPPRRMSPVEVPPISTWPLPEPSSEMFWFVPPATTEAALVKVRLVPVSAPPLMLPPEIVAPLMVPTPVVIAPPPVLMVPPPVLRLPDAPTTLNLLEVMFTVSRAEPRLIVSAVVLLVPRLIVFPAVPVPKLMVFALLPVPRFTAPVVPESTVIALVLVDCSVRVVPPVMARALVLLSVLVVPRLIVPLPACRVRLPVLVLIVLAALPVMLSAWLAADWMVAVEALPKVSVLPLKVLVL